MRMEEMNKSCKLKKQKRKRKSNRVKKIKVDEEGKDEKRYERKGQPTK